VKYFGIVTAFWNSIKDVSYIYLLLYLVNVHTTKNYMHTGQVCIYKCVSKYSSATELFFPM